MSKTGHGKPIDILDHFCKEYKDCQRCARKTFGDECIEDVKYDLALEKDSFGDLDMVFFSTVWDPIRNDWIKKHFSKKTNEQMFLSKL